MQHDRKYLRCYALLGKSTSSIGIRRNYRQAHQEKHPLQSFETMRKMHCIYTSYRPGRWQKFGDILEPHFPELGSRKLGYNPFNCAGRGNVVTKSVTFLTWKHWYIKSRPCVRSGPVSAKSGTPQPTNGGWLNVPHFCTSDRQ